MWIGKNANQDLDIHLYKNDVRTLQQGNDIYAVGGSFFVRMALGQKEFSVKPHLFVQQVMWGLPNDYTVLGYTVEMTTSALAQCMADEQHMPAIRGLGFGLDFDRLHILYENICGENISRAKNPLMNDPHLRICANHNLFVDRDISDCFN